MTNYENPVLQERGKSYGEYAHNAFLAQNLKATLRSGAKWGAMPHYMRESFDMVAAKLARAVNGDYKHRDNLVDAAAYLELALIELDKETGHK